MSTNGSRKDQSHYFSENAPATDAEIEYRSVSLGPFDVRVATAHGVFSHEHLDIGTSILLRTVDALEGPLDFTTAADVGCGWGPIALYLALARASQPGAENARVLAIDVNERALDLTRRNAISLGTRGISPLRADDPSARMPLDLIVSNPPIRIGKPALHELLASWLPLLRIGGAAYLVVAKHLGADSLQRWLAEQLSPADASVMLTPDGPKMVGEVERVATSKGFRILRVQRTA